jgi:hypothetical protein
MLRVVEKESTFLLDNSKANIVVESDETGPPFQKAFDELSSIEARTIAQSYAMERGIISATVNGNVIGPYPVNSRGVPLDKVLDRSGKVPPPDSPEMQPEHYRVEVPVTRPIR